MTNQPNNATVKDGLSTAEEVLKEKVPPALYKRGDCYVGHALDAMQSYSDQQNAELKSDLEHNTNRAIEIAKERDEALERVKELEGAVSELRTAFANYQASEGCSCCRDSDNHRDAEHAIGELLGVAKHDDDSGYDFNQYQTIYK